jgi:prepilin-type N-terminal cleavage/methylation domain-containing protein
MLHKNKNADNGFTLIGMMITLAVMAVITMVAIPDWITFENDAALTSSAATLRTAQLSLFRCAAQGTGATLSAGYRPDGLTTLSVQSNGQNVDCWTGHLQEGAVPLIGGKQLSCTSVSATGEIATAVSCQSAQTGQWTVQYAGLFTNVS